MRRLIYYINWLASKLSLQAGPRQPAHWYPTCKSPKVVTLVLAVGTLVPVLPPCLASACGNPKGNYRNSHSFRPHARGTMAYSRVRRAVSLWIATDCLSYAIVDTPAFRAMLRALDPQAPDLSRKSVTTEGCIRICFLLHFMFVLFHLLFLWLMLWLLLNRAHGYVTQGWSG